MYECRGGQEPESGRRTWPSIFQKYFGISAILGGQMYECRGGPADDFPEIISAFPPSVVVEPEGGASTR